MVILAHRARSSQIATAARLIAISWLFSLQIWILIDTPWRSFAFAAVDLALAWAFLQMSRGRWFPAPLFFLHAGLVLYHMYAVMIEAHYFWIAAFFNRALELAVFYIIGCAAFRLYVLQKRKSLH